MAMLRIAQVLPLLFSTRVECDSEVTDGTCFCHSLFWYFSHGIGVASSCSKSKTAFLVCVDRLRGSSTGRFGDRRMDFEAKKAETLDWIELADSGTCVPHV
jgi:hypothetical protein